MIDQSLPNVANVKVKFFLGYLLSVVLGVVVVLSLLKGGSEGNQVIANTTAIHNDDDSFLEETNAVLQTKLETLSKTYLSNTTAPTGGQKPAAVEAAESDMKKTLEDVRARVENLEGSETQVKAQHRLTFFENSFDHQNRLYVQFLQSELKTQNANSTVNAAELEQLKNSLAQKEKEVLALQASLREKPSVIARQPTDDAKQWKEKAAGLKAANDKLSKQVNNMTASYQIIVEDNKRLLSRLQASKKQ